MNSVHYTSAPTGIFLFSIFCMALTSCSPDLGKHANFYKMPSVEQEVEIHKYPLEEQVDVYLIGERELHHGSGLASQIARNGASIVPILTNRLTTTESDEEKTALLYLFLMMEAGHDYPVSSDPDLMRVLEMAVSSIGDLYRARALNYLDGIRNFDKWKDSGLGKKSSTRN